MRRLILSFATLLSLLSCTDEPAPVDPRPYGRGCLFSAPAGDPNACDGECPDGQFCDQGACGIVCVDNSDCAAHILQGQGIWESLDCVRGACVCNGCSTAP